MKVWILISLVHALGQAPSVPPKVYVFDTVERCLAAKVIVEAGMEAAKERISNIVPDLEPLVIDNRCVGKTVNTPGKGTKI